MKVKEAEEEEQTREMKREKSIWFDVLRKRWRRRIHLHLFNEVRENYDTRQATKCKGSKGKTPLFPVSDNIHDLRLGGVGAVIDNVQVVWDTQRSVLQCSVQDEGKKTLD